MSTHETIDRNHPAESEILLAQTLAAKVIENAGNSSRFVVSVALKTRSFPRGFEDEVRRLVDRALKRLVGTIAEIGGLCGSTIALAGRVADISARCVSLIVNLDENQCTCTIEACAATDKTNAVRAAACAVLNRQWFSSGEAATGHSDLLKSMPFVAGADPCGFVADLALVAISDYFGYLAVRIPTTAAAGEGRWGIVGKVPVPVVKGAHFTRQADDATHVCWLNDACRPKKGADRAALRYISAAHCPPAFAVLVFSWCARRLASDGAVVVELEEAYTVGTPTSPDLADVSSLQDLVSLADASLVRSRARIAKYADDMSLLTSGGVVSMMSDCANAHFTDSRLRNSSLRTQHTASVKDATSQHRRLCGATWRAGQPSSLEEGPSLELKHHVSEAGRGAQADVERLRHTVAAMASTSGGAIVVGVRDDGTVDGHAPGDVLGALRTSAFFPALPRDGVLVSEHAVRPAGVTALPADWWKKIASSSTALVEGPKSVVTVVAVRPGAAPYYTASGTSHNLQPTVRGQASNIKLPVLGVQARIAPFITTSLSERVHN